MANLDLPFMAGFRCLLEFTRDDNDSDGSSVIVIEDDEPVADDSQTSTDATSQGDGKFNIQTCLHRTLLTKRQADSQQQAPAQDEIQPSADPAEQQVRPGDPQQNVENQEAGEPSNATAAAVSSETDAAARTCTRLHPQTKKPCNVTFVRDIGLPRHHDSVHDNPVKVFYCQYCRENLTFSRYDTMG